MKKNLISIVILALLIVNIVLTSIMMFSVVSTNKKTAALVTDIASAISLELGDDAEEEAVTVPMDQTEPYTISDLTIILKKGVSEDGTVEEKDHVAILSVTLSMNTKHKDYKTYGADLSTREDLIKGQIIEAVSQYTVDEIKENQKMVTDDILNRIQKLFDSDFIFDVSFSSTLYQ